MSTRPHPLRILVALAAVALAASACDAAGDAGSDSSLSPSTTTSVAPVTEPPPPPVNRLLVVDDVGNVVTMQPDGSDVQPLTEDGNVAGYFQPIWSPDADAVATSRFGVEGFSLVRIDAETAEATSVDTEANAFYMYWSPDGSQIGYLSTGAAGMGLRLADFEAADEAEELDLGQPFYFDWSPEGDRLATLIGERRFDVRNSVAGAVPTEIAQPGSFLNPVWTDAGLFYVRTEAGVDHVVLGEPGGEVQVLAVAPAPLIMTAPRSGDRIAVQATGDLNGVETRFQNVPTLPLNRLVILEVATGEITRVTDGPVPAYFWDPSGEKLLVLDQEPGARRLRWSVWADGRLTPLTGFLPSRVWADTFLPFFGQYALSTTMWAPDGSAFAFPGLIGELGGIYVQDIAGGDPMYVSDGNWVTWSPR